jgi:hypothetical protein
MGVNQPQKSITVWLLGWTLNGWRIAAERLKSWLLNGWSPTVVSLLLSFSTAEGHKTWHRSMNLKKKKIYTCTVLPNNLIIGFDVFEFNVIFMGQNQPQKSLTVLLLGWTAEELPLNRWRVAYERLKPNSHDIVIVVFHC